MSRLATTTRFVLIFVLMVAIAPFVSAQEGGGTLYDVTVTNLTQGQILSPPIVVSHRNTFRVFNAGEAASAELAALAEDADSAALLALLGAEPEVNDVNIAGDVVMPGGSQTVQIEFVPGANVLTTLGMLITTNDAFFSATGRVSGRGVTFNAPAYDAGSEANTQECAHIPGPPCGNPFVRVTDGAEGFVFISSGVRAAGDLDVALHDWLNPVARITVTRVVE